VLTVGGFNAWRGALLAANVRAGLVPSRPGMYLRTMVFELVFLATVTVGVRLRGASLETVFGQRWRSATEMIRDLGIGAALWLLTLLAVSILGGHGGPPDQSIGYLLPRTSMEFTLWIALSLVAGICEEAIFRGYLQRQFSAITDNRIAGILVSSALFGAAHAYQGLQRATVIAISAVLFGVVVEWRGTVRPGMFAHSFQDVMVPLLVRLLRP
jgi:membrane protease YdiL (CAAX protease family)